MRCEVRIDRSTSSRVVYVERDWETDLTREGGREGGVLCWEEDWEGCMLRIGIEIVY